MGRKLILSNIHLGQLLLKCYFLQLDRLIWKLQTFHNLLDIHLAVLSHIDHPIKQSIDSLLIVLQNIGDLDHIAAVVIEWVVKYEFQEVDELGIAFRLLEFAGLEGDVHQFGDVVPSVHFGAKFVCVLVDTLLEVIEFFDYWLSDFDDKMSHILKRVLFLFTKINLIIYWYFLSLNSLYINHITAAPISDTTQFCFLPYRSHSYRNRYRTLPPLGKEQPSPSSEIHQSQSLYSSDSSASRNLHILQF